MTPIYLIRIRRDAHTTTPVQVGLHEVPVLQAIFGEENIHNIHGKPLVGDEAATLGEADIVGEREFSANDEYDRLAIRYGGNDEGLFVEQVYGKKVTKALDKAIEVKKAAKADAKAATKDAEK